MIDFSLRHALQHESESIRRCIAAAYAPFAGHLPGLPDVTGGLREDIANGRVWVAVRGPQLFGVLVLTIGDDDAHLNNIAVHPSAHNRGVARRLIEHAEEEAREAGCHCMHLTTHSLIPANIERYEHLGWHVDSRDGQKVFMVKNL